MTHGQQTSQGYGSHSTEEKQLMYDCGSVSKDVAAYWPHGRLVDSLETACEQLVQTVSLSLMGCTAQHGWAWLLALRLHKCLYSWPPTALPAGPIAAGRRRAQGRCSRMAPGWMGQLDSDRGIPSCGRGWNQTGFMVPSTPSHSVDTDSSRALGHLSGQWLYPIRASKPSDNAEDWAPASRVPIQSTACYSLNVLENLRTRLETITFTTKNSMTTFLVFSDRKLKCFRFERSSSPPLLGTEKPKNFYKKTWFLRWF